MRPLTGSVSLWRASNWLRLSASRWCSNPFSHKSSVSVELITVPFENSFHCLLTLTGKNGRLSHTVPLRIAVAVRRVGRRRIYPATSRPSHWVCAHRQTRAHIGYTRGTDRARAGAYLLQACQRNGLNNTRRIDAAIATPRRAI